MNYKIVIIITPLQQYAQQNINRFYDYEPNRKALLIDSDGSRNINEIYEFIKNNDKILFSATYKSCDMINQLILSNDMFIIFDEFHNFSVNNIYNNKKNIYNDKNNINNDSDSSDDESDYRSSNDDLDNNIENSDSSNDESDACSNLDNNIKDDDIYLLINNDNVKKLYLSATPRIYTLEYGNDIDITEIFGDYIYKMSFNEAITNKYISDYELYLPIFDSNTQYDEEINNLNIHQDYLLKIQFLIEAIKMCGTLKMIIYMKTHDEITNFITEFNKINDNYYYYDVDIREITCKNSYNSRNKILKDFNDSTKLSLLFSVRILDEAIDIPSCNAIYMTYVSSSKVKNIQRMSRSMRYQNKKIAKIFLFCNEIDESLDYISSIKEYDIDFNRKINYLSISEKYKNVKERIKFNHENIEKNKITISGIKLYKGKTWTQILELVKKYIDEHKKRPSRNNENDDIKMLGKWIDTQLQNFRNKIYINKNQDKYNSWIEFINNYKIHFDNHIKWFHYLVQLKKYINDNNKLPSQYDDNIKNAKIYSWLNGQQY
jgi:superfamily II DNA or RNA helicase